MRKLFRGRCYDEVNVLDARGWYYCYAHLKSIDGAVRPGRSVKMGQKIGVLGKEGGSGGWSHLHFHITTRQPSGEWGIEEGYAFLWEAYLRQYSPTLIAVARPHHLAAVGQKVMLDGTRSWSTTGKIKSHDSSLLRRGRFQYGGGTPLDAGPLGHCTATFTSDGKVGIESKGRRGIPGARDVVVYETESLGREQLRSIWRAADAALREKPFARRGVNEELAQPSNPYLIP